MSKHGKAFRTARDVTGGVGIFSMIVGLYWAWPPLAWLGGGVSLIACVIVSHRMEPKDTNREG